MSENLFNQFGHFLGTIPQECVNDCSHAGDCFDDCQRWANKLKLEVPRDLTINYLKSTGGWTFAELQEMTGNDLSIRVLWIACCDIKENGEWFGLCN